MPLLISANHSGQMNKFILFLLFNIVFSNINIETKQYTFYKDNNTSSIEFFDIIDNFNSFYKIELIAVSDIEFEKDKKVFIEQCDLKFKLNNSKSSIKVSRCSDEFQYKGNLYIDRNTATISIDALKYSKLSCTFTFWVTGVFIYQKNKLIHENDGQLREYYSDGTLKIEYLFKNGKKDGIQKKWYNNGQLEILYNYKEGRLSGLQKKWYENGVLKGNWNYRNDKLHGIVTEWYPDNSIKFIKEYNTGILVELIENNDSNGKSY
jgi:hypothetical protein